MSVTEFIIVLWIGCLLILLITGLCSGFRRFISRSFDNWMYERRKRKYLFKHNSTHIKKYDWIKLYSSIIGILLAVIIVSGVLSHFGTVSKAKKVCYARLETKECNTIDEHEYFIPGTKASVFDFPYKLGIAYKCGCDDDSKTIIINMATKPEKEKSVPNRFFQWLTETDGTNNTQ